MVNEDHKNPHAPAVDWHTPYDVTPFKHRLREWADQARHDARQINKRLNGVVNPSPDQVHTAVRDYMGTGLQAQNPPPLQLQPQSPSPPETVQDSGPGHVPGQGLVTVAAARAGIANLIQEMLTTNYYLLTIPQPYGQFINIDDFMEEFDQVKLAQINLRNGFVALRNSLPTPSSVQESAEGQVAVQETDENQNRGEPVASGEAPVAVQEADENRGDLVQDSA